MTSISGQNGDRACQGKKINFSKEQWLKGMAQYTCGLYYKCFMIVIYNSNVKFMIVMTVAFTILTSLALATIIIYDDRVVIYGHKVCYKLKCTLRL